jgi:hypothetical protein
MKTLGLLLIVGALIAGGIILSDTIPGYLRNKDYLVRTHAEAKEAVAKMDKLPANATERDIEYAISHAKQANDSIRDAEESVERRRNETLMFGGGSLAVTALGLFLFFRGRRKPATA